jgi:hypothetical protein
MATFVYQPRSEDAWDARANQALDFNIEDMTVIQRGKWFVLGCWDDGLTLMTDKRFRKTHRGATVSRKGTEKDAGGSV